MHLVSIRIITDDVTGLADFYGRLTGGIVDRPHELFAEVRTPAATIAIGARATVGLFAPGSVHPADHRSTIIEFLVQDADAEFAKLREWVPEFVSEPATMPWGNRSVLLRDPDGNLVNVFSPATDDARDKFARFLS